MNKKLKKNLNPIFHGNKLGEKQKVSSIKSFEQGQYGNLGTKHEPPNPISGEKRSAVDREREREKP